MSASKATDLSHTGASAVMHVTNSDLVFLSPLFRSLLLSDPLHAYLGLCGLSLIGEPNLRKVHPGLNITQRAFQYLQQLQQTWRDSADTCRSQHWRTAAPPSEHVRLSATSNSQSWRTRRPGEVWPLTDSPSHARTREDFKTLYKAVALGSWFSVRSKQLFRLKDHKPHFFCCLLFAQ